MDTWSALVWFLASLTILALLSRWISGLVQGLGLLLFNDEQATFLLTFLVFFPGILIHELSHWGMAWLLGMRPRQLSVWPKMRGKRVEMGSVHMRSGGPLRDSLAGLAPLLVGSLILLGVSYQVFDAAALQRAWEGGGFGAVWNVFWATFGVPDAWLWAYLVFAVSNAMIPSPSDRQPLFSLLLYVIVVGLLFYLLGWIPRFVIPADMVAHVTRALRTLITAFAFTIALDILIALPLLAVQFLLVPLVSRQVDK